jgi:hypothetical protein
MTRIALLAASLLALATTASATDPRTAELAPITVVGKSSGPPIWELKRGDKTLWILGTLHPVPRDIPVDTTEIEARIAQSQVVLGSSGIAIGEDLGFFQTLFLLPAARCCPPASTHDGPRRSRSTWAAETASSADVPSTPRSSCTALH